MCGGAILSSLTPNRVHRRLTAARLWPNAYFPAERTTAGKRKRKAAPTTDDEFEAEFQVFVEEDEDDDEAEAPLSAESAAVARGFRRRRVAGAKNNKYLRLRRRPSGSWAAENRGTRQARRVSLSTYGGDAGEAARACDREARRTRGKSARLDSPNEGCSRRRNLPGIIDLNQPPAVSGDHMIADAGNEPVESTLTKIKRLMAGGPHDERMESLVTELMDGAHHGSGAGVSLVVRCAALISECSREMAEVAALSRDLKNRMRQLDERKGQLVKISSVLMATNV